MHLIEIRNLKSEASALESHFQNGGGEWESNPPRAFSAQHSF
jgi:hypothetical protein